MQGDFCKSDSPQSLVYHSIHPHALIPAYHITAIVGKTEFRLPSVIRPDSPQSLVYHSTHPHALIPAYHITPIAGKTEFR